MSKKIYALLVGINDYQSKVVPKLSGCVNDVRHMLEFRELRTKDGGFMLEPMVLTAGDVQNPNEVKPTRQAIIEAFRQHLHQAGKDDVAQFYYSGHGSQEQAPRGVLAVGAGSLERDHRVRRQPLAGPLGSGGQGTGVADLVDQTQQIPAQLETLQQSLAS